MGGVVLLLSGGKATGGIIEFVGDESGLDNAGNAGATQVTPGISVFEGASSPHKSAMAGIASNAPLCSACETAVVQKAVHLLWARQ
jgi:hypothetical protein